MTDRFVVALAKIISLCFLFSMSSTLKVTKAVIPTAGLGTRFLPASKTIPKELFPIIDRPILLFIVEEAVRAGIEDIVLVTGRGKSAIEDFFDTSYELEDQLQKVGKLEWLEDIRRIKSLANIISIRQKEALGLGHAILSSYPAVGESPFAVLLGDELMINSSNENTVTGQLIEHFDKTHLSTVAVMEVSAQEVNKYGIIDYSQQSKNDHGQFQYRVHRVLEKPHLDIAPSNLALPGRYVFSAKIFSHLANTSAGVNGEIQLTDGMTLLAQDEGLEGLMLKTRRYDAGDKFGYLRANIELGLEHEELAEPLRAYLRQLAKDL